MWIASSFYISQNSKSWIARWIAKLQLYKLFIRHDKKMLTRFILGDIIKLFRRKIKKI